MIARTKLSPQSICRQGSHSGRMRNGHLLMVGSFLAFWTVLVVPAFAGLPTNSLVIGIDGLGYGQRGLDRVDTPKIDSLMDGSWNAGYSGSYTDEAFAGGLLWTRTQQSTVSGPGWSTILTGVWTDRHRVTGNSFSNPDYERNPVYLETLEETNPDIVTASFVNWDPIDKKILKTADDANSRMDKRSDLASDFSVSSAAVKHLREADPNSSHAVFVAIDDVDIAGHQCGSSGECYERSIRIADVMVGRMLDSLRSRENLLSENWQIVLTSDHGHRPSGGHGGQSELERRIPFIVSSKQASQDVMEERGGTPVSHADVAPTVLDHFGIEIPERYWGASRAGNAAILPGDFNADGTVDRLDIDLLSRAEDELIYDVNLDGSVTTEDRVFLVERILNTWFGDANLDGQFANDDLITVFISGTFEDRIPLNSGWVSGDWNGDLEFDTGDLIIAFQGGGYGQGPRSLGIAVPEPSTLSWMAVTLCGVLLMRRGSLRRHA